MTIDFRPAVVVGLGGMGTFLAWNVREQLLQQLNRQIELGLITPDQRDNAMQTRFQFVAIDSHPDDYSKRIGDFVNLVEGSEALFVDDAVAGYQRRASFAEWWEPGYTGNVENFFKGCGHVHLKGKLAYYRAKEFGRNPATKIEAALNRAMNAAHHVGLPPGGAVPVFVCASLGGGTGGGNFLTLLQEIHRMGQQVAIYGCIIDASVYTADNKGFADIERANNWRGLIELDAWLNADRTLANSVQWTTFLPAEDESATIQGVNPVARLVWLFGAKRVNQVGLPTLQSRVSAAADSIASWIHSSTSQVSFSMDSDVESWLGSRGAGSARAIGRSMRFGAMASSHFTFPAGRVKQFVGSELAAAALRDQVLGRRTAPPNAALTWATGFLNKHLLLEEQVHVDQVLDRLRGLKRLVPLAPGLEDDLKSVKPNEYKSAVNNAKARINTPASENTLAARLPAYRDACRTLCIRQLGSWDDVTSVRGDLKAEVEEMLKGSSAGLLTSVTFLQALRVQIVDHEAASLRKELGKAGESRESTASQAVTVQARLVQLEMEFPQQLQEVQGSGIRAMGGRGTRIERFCGSWWRDWIQVQEDIVEREEALRLYDQLIKEIDRHVEILNQIRQASEDALTDLEARAQTALDRPDPQDALRVVEILTDRDKIRETFGWAMSVPLQLANTFAATPDGIHHAYRALLQAKIDEESSEEPKEAAKTTAALRLSFRRVFADSLLTSAIEHVGGAIDAMSIWEAVAKGAASEDRVRVLTHVDDELDRLFELASPQFPVTVSQKKELPISPPINSVFLVAEPQSTARFAARLGLGDTWPVSSLSKAGEPLVVQSADRHRVSVLRRTIGFPLLMMDNGLKLQALNAYAAEAKSFVSFNSDRRAGKLPNHVDPIVLLQIEYVAALALGFGILHYGQDRAGNPAYGRVLYKRETSQYAAGLAKLMDALAQKRERLDALIADVDAFMTTVPHADWLGRVDAILADLESQLDQERAKGSDRVEQIGKLKAAVEGRYESVRNLYKAHDPSTHPNLEGLRRRGG